MTNVYKVYTYGGCYLVYNTTDYKTAMYFKYCYDYFFKYSNSCVDVSSSNDYLYKDSIFIGSCNSYFGD